MKPAGPLGPRPRDSTGLTQVREADGMAIQLRGAPLTASPRRVAGGFHPWPGDAAASGPAPQVIGDVCAEIRKFRP